MKRLHALWPQWPKGLIARVAGLLSVTAALMLGLALPGHAQTPHQTIASGGPLRQIFLGNELSAQIGHVADPAAYQVYPPNETPADYGTLAVIDGTLYAPDFQARSTATGAHIGPYTPFTPVSQTAAAGAGTLADPFRVETTVAAGSTGIGIRQTDSYVQGQDVYRTDITFTNSGTAPKNIIAYRAMDCYLGADDRGYGWASGANISCSKNPNNSPPGRVLSLMPMSAGSQYAYDGYAQIWQHIRTQQPFANTCTGCADHWDNGIGLSWNITVPVGGSVTLSHLTLFSPTGALPLATAKTASAASVAAGGTVNYTITVTNPNASAVTLDALVDTLPTGFAYVAGSTTGATTANPAVAGQALTWSGLQVPASGSITVNFGATVSTVGGTYYNRVQATASGYTVLESGETAPVNVTAATPPPVQPLQTAASVSPGSSSPGGEVTYTLTVTNPNAAAVTLDTLAHTLPAGFSHVPGSTSGASAANPAVAGQTLTWSALPVPAGGALTLRFRTAIGASVPPGTYPSSVQAAASGYAAPGVSGAAPVTVVAATTPPPAPPGSIAAVPALSPWALLGMAGLLAGLSARRLKGRKPR